MLYEIQGIIFLNFTLLEVDNEVQKASTLKEIIIIVIII
jgi:hypothetical protein